MVYIISPNGHISKLNVYPMTYPVINPYLSPNYLVNYPSYNIDIGIIGYPYVPFNIGRNN